MPDRPPGRGRMRDRVAARVSFSAVCRALSDYALSAVPTTADAHGEPTDPLVVARWVQATTQELKWRAVVLALESGASWLDVARTLQYRDRDGQPDEAAAREAYEQECVMWKDGALQAWTPPGCRPVCPDAEDDPVVVARNLDAWYQARTGGGAPLTSRDRAVSGALRLV